MVKIIIVKTLIVKVLTNIIKPAAKVKNNQLQLLLLLIYFKLTNLQIVPYKNIQYKIAK